MDLPIIQDLSRKIIHVDMDAFYAQLEMIRDPKLVSKALVIGSDPRKNGNRGVVSTANYVARKYGVHSAMSSYEALDLVPNDLLVYKDPDFEYYRDMSNKIHNIFRSVTDVIEPIALDEAFLDVTDNKLNEPSAVKLGTLIQTEIFQQLGITSSVGISHNKFLAKLGSDYNKPNGRTVILPETAQLFINALNIKEFRGIGKKTLPVLNDMGVFTGDDLRKIPIEVLTQKFGKSGYYMYLHARGVDNRAVKVRLSAKSISKETTLNHATADILKIKNYIYKLSDKVFSKTQNKNYNFKTVVVKLKDEKFNTFSKRFTDANYIVDNFTMKQIALDLMDEIMKQNNYPRIRLIGVGVTGLTNKTFANIDFDI